MTPKLSRSALIAAVEALAEKSANQSEMLKISDDAIEAFRAQLEASNKRIYEQAAEIACLKGEIAKRPNGRIIRRHSWPGGMRLSVVNCQLVRSGQKAISVMVQNADELTATDWEEVDAPTCQPKETL